MAKPIILIKQHVLREIHDRHLLGVPYSRLVKDFELNIHPLTLQKLVTVFDTMVNAKDEKIKKQIENSLFPKWLTNDNSAIYSIQNHNIATYEGKFPFGHWIS